ncbi:hypothetical protein GO755_24525 [Spirosoma sp. HMF4905]|uniref:Carboxypeptidase regulatory-like domain-containing protein n=1 Tax=Spirosoma arboris TaxID=2682092 RepID=A0A7K1SHE7_9BACT|nr:hypothetical protein [Spirosoma arboris]MVM33229.1 hypothetical protein [Spirosoma arboris]
MRISSILLALLLGFSLTTCAQKNHRRKITKSIAVQGICGTVLVKRGNHMPGPDSPKSNATGSPVEREVLIFPLLNMSQVEAGDNGFINSVGAAKPIKTIKSEKDGTFCVSLPTGRYSVIVQEPKGLYANLYDTKNNIFPVTVEKNKTAQIKVEITHQAVF